MADFNSGFKIIREGQTIDMASDLADIYSGIASIQENTDVANDEAIAAKGYATFDSFRYITNENTSFNYDSNPIKFEVVGYFDKANNGKEYTKLPCYTEQRNELLEYYDNAYCERNEKKYYPVKIGYAPIHVDPVVLKTETPANSEEKKYLYISEANLHIYIKKADDDGKTYLYFSNSWGAVELDKSVYTVVITGGGGAGGGCGNQHIVNKLVSGGGGGGGGAIAIAVDVATAASASENNVIHFVLGAGGSGVKDKAGTDGAASYAWIDSSTDKKDLDAVKNTDGFIGAAYGGTGGGPSYEDTSGYGGAGGKTEIKTEAVQNIAVGISTANGGNGLMGQEWMRGGNFKDESSHEQVSIRASFISSSNGLAPIIPVDYSGVKIKGRQLLSASGSSALCAGDRTYAVYSKQDQENYGSTNSGTCGVGGIGYYQWSVSDKHAGYNGKPGGFEIFY